MKDFDDRFVFRSWDEYNLHEDATIDKYSLDEIAEHHPHNVQKWLDILVQAQAELSTAKELLQNEEARLFLKSKIDGIEGMAKPTDTASKAWVRIQPEMRKALRRKRKAENDVNYLQNARSVLEHTKAMIKNEIDLYITGYFAKPSGASTDALKEELDEEARVEHGVKLKNSLSRRHLRKGSEE